MELGLLLLAFDAEHSSVREEVGVIGQPYSLEPCYSNSCPLTPSRSTTWEPVEMQMLRPHSRPAASAYAFK